MLGKVTLRNSSRHLSDAGSEEDGKRPSPFKRSSTKYEGLLPSIHINSGRLEHILQEMEERIAGIEEKIALGIPSSVSSKEMPQSGNANTSTSVQKSAWEALEKEIPKMEPKDLVKLDSMKINIPVDEEDMNDDQQCFNLLQKQITSVAQALNELNNNATHKAALQEATDKAQDEMMKMEFDGMRRDIARCVSNYEQEEFRQQMEERMMAIEGQVQSKIVAKMRRTEERVDTSIGKVVKQVTTLMQTMDDVNRVQDARFSSLQHQIKTDVVQTLIREKRVYGGPVGGDSNGSGQDPITQLKKQQVALQQCIDTIQGESSRIEEMVKQDRQALNGMQTSLELLATGIETNIMGKVDTTIKTFKQDTEENMLNLKNFSKEAQLDAKHEIATLKQENEQGFIEMEKKAKERDMQMRNKMETEVVRRVVSCEEQLHHLGSNLVKQLQTQTKHMESEIHQLQEQTQMVINESINELSKKLKDVKYQADGTQHQLDKENKALMNELSELKESSNNRLQNLHQMSDVLRKDLQSVIERSVRDSKRVNDTVDQLNKNTEESLELLEQSNKDQNSNFETWMDKMALLMTGHQDTTNERCHRVERSNVALAVLVRKFEQNMEVLLNKDQRWDLMDVQWQSFVKALGDRGVNWEAKAKPGKLLTMSPQLTRFLIQMGWRVGKLIGTKADLEVSREVLSHPKPEEEEWDYKVASIRQSNMNRFINDVAKYCKKKAPHPDMLTEEARGVYLKKTEMCVKLCLSKFKQLQIGATLFGRVKLEQACAACDRPFVHAGPVDGGNPHAAVEYNDALPPKPARNPRNREMSVLSDNMDDGGSVGSTGSFMPHTTHLNGKVSAYGKAGQKFVYRGGFKIPKKVVQPKLGMDYGDSDATVFHSRSVESLPTSPHHAEGPESHTQRSAAHRASLDSASLDLHSRSSSLERSRTSHEINRSAKKQDLELSLPHI